MSLTCRFHLEGCGVSAEQLWEVGSNAAQVLRHTERSGGFEIQVWF
jgi:hypothetical protein